MSIVPLRRVTLCGLIGEKAETLEGLQALGVVHLVPLTPSPPLAVHDPTVTRRAETAFRHLAQAGQRAIAYRPDTPFDERAVVQEILDNRARLRKLHDRRASLGERFDALDGWGDLHFSPIEEMGGQRLWFYELPVKERTALARISLPWQIVNATGGTLYVALISPEEPDDDLLPAPRIHTGTRPRSVLHREFEDTLIEIEQAEAQRAELTRWRLVLGARLAEAADRVDREAAAGQTRDEGRVFVVQGWAPAESLAEIDRFAAERGLALETETPGVEDAPPTLLRPPEAVASGAALTNSYATPAYSAWDPSVVVFAAFSIFFAMIMADAGYAALIAIGAAVFWRRMGRTEGGRRGRALLAAVSVAGIVYGVLCGSWFGAALPPKSLLARLAILDVNDFHQMMVLSILVGAVHITIALAIAAWVARWSGRTLTAVGWMVALWSGIALLEQTRAGVATLPHPEIGVGAGFAAVAIGAMLQSTPGMKRGVFARVAGGVLALAGVSKLFGDVLSYLRLFALGLASASLAGTFNSLAAEVRPDKPGLGLVFALLILALGHAINFALALMSGVVHGLRLNFIEFFGWGLPEEGYPFRPFARRQADP